MTLSDDFSTNRHVVGFERPLEIVLPPRRHPDLCFDDGNIAVLSGSYYFIIHQGLVCRHSAPLATAIKELNCKLPVFLETRPVVELSDSPNELYYFLRALYDGVSTLTYKIKDFETTSAILRLSTKYEVDHLRNDIIRIMSPVWPRTLGHWEFREAEATNQAGFYEPRSIYPHPLLVINLAREAKAPELLPSAYYDLSRCSPSDIVMGHPASPTDAERQFLHDDDVMNVFRGKEHAARFLSSFIVSHLEGRGSSVSCIYRTDRLENSVEMMSQRTCRASFEAITFEMVRDVNGVVLHRTTDPLFAMMDADLMQTRNGPHGRINVAFRACEPCRLEFSAAVDAAREELWLNLPDWFSVELESWP